MVAGGDFEARRERKRVRGGGTCAPINIITKILSGVLGMNSEIGGRGKGLRGRMEVWSGGGYLVGCA